MSTISINGMEFYAYHGCFKEEQIIGTRFLVDISLVLNTFEAEISDDLSKTVNYQSVYEVIKREMSIKSKLLENVARRIADAIIREFPVFKADVTIKKLNPPLGGKIDNVSITISS